MSILAKIAESVSERMAERKALRSQRELELLSMRARDPHNFLQALRDEPTAIICEIKFASPSTGLFAKAQTLTAVQVAGEYLKNGAAALSILTEEDYFRGNLAFIGQVREAYPEAKILMKDFMLDPYQILEAKLAGADAILLIVALLGKDRTATLYKQAKALGLSVLVEVHDEEELQIAESIGVELIGVNNRNLKTMQISLDTSRNLANKKQSKAMFISESGLSNIKDLSELQNLGYQGFLVGTSLMESGEPGINLRNLLGGVET